MRSQMCQSRCEAEMCDGGKSTAPSVKASPAVGKTQAGPTRIGQITQDTIKAVLEIRA